jgi:hypothetical protein
MHWFVPTLNTAFGGKNTESHVFRNRQRFCIKHKCFCCEWRVLTSSLLVRAVSVLDLT